MISMHLILLFRLLANGAHRLICHTEGRVGTERQVPHGNIKVTNLVWENNSLNNGSDTNTKAGMLRVPW